MCAECQPSCIAEPLGGNLETPLDASLSLVPEAARSAQHSMSPRSKDAKFGNIPFHHTSFVKRRTAGRFNSRTERFFNVFNAANCKLILLLDTILNKLATTPSHCCTSLSCVEYRGICQRVSQTREVSTMHHPHSYGLRCMHNKEHRIC
eukprot:m.442299 g.442299  ORF g.442299 m.442299 type:complete len:149 (+) comp21472_c0_seq9:620-1066(+)